MKAKNPITFISSCSRMNGPMKRRNEFSFISCVVKMRGEKKNNRNCCQYWANLCSDHPQIPSWQMAPFVIAAKPFFFWFHQGIICYDPKLSKSLTTFHVARYTNAIHLNHIQDKSSAVTSIQNVFDAFASLLLCPNWNAAQLILSNCVSLFGFVQNASAYGWRKCNRN